MKLDSATYRLTDSGNLRRLPLILTIVGAASSLVMYFSDPGHFFHAYLTAFTFWMTIGLGALFFTLIQHIVAAEWSIVVRRLAENAMILIPFMAILFIPIALGIGQLYEWSHADVVAKDHLLSQKAGYLNVPFFLARAALYFVIWFFLTRSLYKSSLTQDSQPSESLIVRMRRVSAPGLVLFALSLTFMAFDWLMSLDPHWYSTIFGVYIFSGSVIGFMAFLTLVSMYLRSRGALDQCITVEHYHDYGKLLFAFVVFWAYIAFSQFFLIWYGNIPEETMFFHHRAEGSWLFVSAILLPIGHFALPFLLLILRSTKRGLGSLRIMAIWMFVLHYIDLYWVSMPNYLHHGPSLLQALQALGPFLFVGGAFMWLFWGNVLASPVVPVNDRRLAASLHFTNA